MTRVKLPTILRSQAGGERDVDATGTTLRELLADLESRYPGVTSLETPVGSGDTISILPAVAGGG